MQAPILLTVWWAIHTASGKLFHDSAVTVLRPSGHDVDSEFGISMAYQNRDPARLVVGAPRKDLFGKVYTCPLSDKPKDNIDCSTIDMSSLAKIEADSKAESKRRDPNQNIFFGSAIAATSDFFLACAPYAPKVVKYKLIVIKGGKLITKPRLLDYSHIYGSCFFQNSTTNEFSEFVDNGVKLNDKYAKNHKLPTETSLHIPSKIARGGLGINTLVDTDKGYLLVAKTAYPTDILYVDIENPLTASKSLAEDYSGNYSGFHKSFFNLGYGMAYGTFFNQSVTLYAISVCYTDSDMKARILFLREIPGRKLEMFHHPDRQVILPYYIESGDVGFMFGYALAAADMNRDGLSELLVGAPAHSDDEAIEFGALHIYVGGDVLSRNNKNRMRTVYGSKEQGRFGSAIATNDIDGDKIPEIFVSAPYEDSGVGTVYMISGDELNRLLVVGTVYKEIQLSMLRLTQRLRGTSGSRQYGFSLQVVQDIDDNGCDELAVSSPESSLVELIRCLPAVNTSISLQLLGPDIVKEDADKFTIEVCLNVTISPKCHAVSGSILVSSSVIGDANISRNTFTYEMTKKQNDKYCENVIVQLPLIKPDKDLYTFIAEISVDKDADREGKVYKPWVVLGAQSQTRNQLDVRRHCDGLECQPVLTHELIWTGRKFIDAQTSARKEVLNIMVKNTGHETKEAQVRLTVLGTQVSALTSHCYKENGGNVYVCSLPTLKRNDTVTIPVILNTTEIDNVRTLDITTELHDRGFTKLQFDPKEFNIPCQLDPASVTLKGSDHYLNVTDEDIENSNIVTISDNHEFYISNKGFITWHLTALLIIKKESYIHNIKVLTTDVCQEVFNRWGKFEFNCRLSPNGVAKIIASIEISKKEIESNINIQDIQVISELSIDLLPTDEKLNATSMSHLQFTKILTVGNNRNLVIMIVVIVAIISLLALTFVLAKYGFFKRTRKQKLLVLQESVRKRSIRTGSEGSKGHRPSVAEGPHCDIEVVDDCVFSEVDITPNQVSKDDVVLIKDTAT